MRIACSRFVAASAALLLAIGSATAQPANDLCANAQVVTAGLPAATGNNGLATMDGPVPACVSNNFGGDVWYRYVSTPSSGPVTIDTCGSSFDTILTVYLANCPTDSSNQVACDDDGTNCGPNLSRVVLTPSPSGGDVFLIRVHGFAGARGNIVLNINTCRPQILSTSGGGNSCNLGFVTLGVTATGISNTFQWFDSSNSPIMGEISPTLNVPNFTASYTCRVTNGCGTVFSPPIQVTRVFSPQLVSGPSPTTICHEDTGSITASANGDALSYQWETEAGIPVADGALFNGTIVSGSQTPTLTFSNPQFGDSQGFRCRIFNGCGSITTPSAQVRLTGVRQFVPSIFPTIQSAIDAIDSGSCGTVIVEPGTYFEHLNFGNRRIHLIASGGPTGNAGPEATIIDGGGLPPSAIVVSDFSNTLGKCVIRGFTIRNGRAALGGGLLAVFGSTPGPTSISDCIFEDNAATGQGGAIYSQGSSGLQLQRVTFRRNAAANFGGAVNQAGGPLFADRCVFDGNSTSAGGSVGGAVMVVASSEQTRLFNCLFTGNTSTGGGAVATQTAPILIRNCTFANNSAPFGAALNLSPSAVVANSIFWGNTGSNHTVAAAPFSITHSDMQAPLLMGVGNISADPLFVSATNFRLRPGSPCIDTGDAPSSAGPLDLDGNERPFNPGGGAIPFVDMGAYEFTPRPTDSCATAPVLAEGSYAFSTEGASTDGLPEPALCSNAGDNNIGSDVWVRYFPSCTGVATLSTCGSNYDTKLGVYRTNDCPTVPGTIVACNDDTSACGSFSTQSHLTLTVTAGEPLLIRLGGYLGGVGNAVLNISCDSGCRRDYNSDGNVDPDDLADVIACFFDVGCTVDLNNDGTEDPDDLADYIAIFFGGC